MDSAESHRRFRRNHRLSFDLLVDPDGALCRLYEVRVTNLFVVKLAARVTYLIGKDGVIQAAYEEVNPRGHAAEVLSRMAGAAGRSPAG